MASRAKPANIFRVLTKGVSRDLVSRKDFLLSVAVTGWPLYLVFDHWRDHVTALVTFAVLFALLLFFALRGFLAVAAARDQAYEAETRAQSEKIDSLTDRIR